MSSSNDAESNSQQVTTLVVGLALVAALVAAVGSLWLTLGMDLRACPLCLYQRACIFCVVGVLAIGLLAQERSAVLVALIGLAPAAAATGLGGFHVYLEYTGKLECPPGIAGIGTAPLQALAAEGIVLILLLLAGSSRIVPGLLAVALGGVLAALMLQSAPKMPPAPTKPYEERLDICRPPYVAPPPEAK